MRKREIQVLEHNTSNIIWRILNEDGASFQDIADVVGLTRFAIRSGVEKSRERTEDDKWLNSIYKQARKEYLCSDSVTV